MRDRWLSSNNGIPLKIHSSNRKYFIIVSNNRGFLILILEITLLLRINIIQDNSNNMTIKFRGDFNLSNNKILLIFLMLRT